MGISDASAAIFGEKFGKHAIKIFGHKKSFEGSLAFLISSMVVMLFFIHKLDYNILLIPIILTLIELFFIFGLDNLVLPLAGAYLIQFLV